MKADLIRRAFMAAVLALACAAPCGALAQAQKDWHGGETRQGSAEELEAAKKFMDEAYRLMNARRYAEAVDPERRALAALEKIYAHDPGMLVFYLRTSFAIEMYAGNYEEAHRQLARADAACMKTKPSAGCRAQIDLEVSSVLFKQKRFEEAEKRVRRALAVMERETGGQSTYTSYALHMLGTALKGLGRNEEADAAEKRAKEIDALYKGRPGRGP